MTGVPREGRILDEGARDVRVEDRVRAVLDELKRLFRKQLPPVGTLGSDGVVELRDGQDSRPHGDLLSAESVRVTRAVEEFLVLENDPAGFLQPRNALQKLRPQEGMLPGDLELLLGQLPF